MTRQAIEQSPEIAAINEQLALAADRQDYTESRRWTNYLTLDPMRLVQNVLGGGDVQRDQIAIASLELEAANLIRRRAAVAEGLAGDVVGLVLKYEKLGREVALAQSQLEAHRMRTAVMEAAYRSGQGSTTSMLSVWQRTETLAARVQEKQILQLQIQQELGTIVKPIPPLAGCSLAVPHAASSTG